MGKASFEEILNRDGRLIYSSVGDSMLPMIKQGRDRILKVRDKDYVICGDNRYRPEYGITDRHIIGVLTAVITDGVEKPLTGRRYGLYVFFWCRLFYVRALILRACSLMKRMGRKRP